MSTPTIKKKKTQAPRKKNAKVSKYAFGPAARKMAGIVHTGKSESFDH